MVVDSTAPTAGGWPERGGGFQLTGARAALVAVLMAVAGGAGGWLAVSEEWLGGAVVLTMLRWLYRVAATLTVGFTVTPALLVPMIAGGLPELRLLRPAVVAAVALAAVSAALLGARAVGEHGPVGTAAEAAVAVSAMAAGWAGLALILQIVVAVGVAALAARAARLTRAADAAGAGGRDQGAAAAGAVSMAALLAVIGLAPLAAVGHGDSSPVMALVRVLHAVSAALYAGNLVGLLACGPARFPAIRHAVRRFHRVAVTSTATLWLTGLALAAAPVLREAHPHSEWIQAAPGDLLDVSVLAASLALVLLNQPWAGLALAKFLMLTLVIFTAGAIQKLVFLKNFETGPWSSNRFWQLALLEVAVLLVVFGMTAVMLTLGPPA